MSAIEKLPSAPRPAPLRAVPIVAKPRSGTHPNIVFSAIVAGAVLVVALWWSNTPSVSGLGDWLTNAGRVTGLGAGYAIVVLLALMARIPAIERGVGADRLARWHSTGGRYTVSLVVAHATLITWGYSLTDNRNLVDETVTLWTQYADVLMATVAMWILIGVGFASARAARKRMRYETWLYIHFYTYLATALAFSHQFATGAEFVDNLWARVVWGAMYSAVAVLLIWYRFLTPLRNSLSQDLKVVAVTRESGDVTSVVVRGKDISALQVSAGQFFRWRFLSKGLWWSANPYSISAVPHTQYLRISVKHLGEHSALLPYVPIGTRVIAEGPYGAMTTAKARQRKALLIAGGVGITPMRALFEELSRERGQLVVLIYRASTSADVVFRRELDDIANRYGSRVIYAIGNRDSSADIVRPGVLEQHLPNLEDCDAFVCGPKAMMDQAQSALRSVGVKKRHINIEDFTF